VRAGEFGGVGLADAIYYLMGGDHRSLKVYKLVETIHKLQGQYQYQGARFCTSRGLREFQAGANWYVMVRTDDRADFIDVEFFRKFDNESSYQYRLTRAEFSIILKKLAEVDNKPLWSRRNKDENSDRHRDEKGAILRRGASRE